MSTYTYQELKDFVHLLPDDHLFEPLNNKNKGCGCVLVQFGRLKGFDFPNVGYTCIGADVDAIVEDGSKIADAIDNLICLNLSKDKTVTAAEVKKIFI